MTTLAIKRLADALSVVRTTPTGNNLYACTTTSCSSITTIPSTAKTVGIPDSDLHIYIAWIYNSASNAA